MLCGYATKYFFKLPLTNPGIYCFLELRQNHAGIQNRLRRAKYRSLEMSLLEALGKLALHALSVRAAFVLGTFGV